MLSRQIIPDTSTIKPYITGSAKRKMTGVQNIMHCVSDTKKVQRKRKSARTAMR